MYSSQRMVVGTGRRQRWPAAAPASCHGRLSAMALAADNLPLCFNQVTKYVMAFLINFISVDFGVSCGIINMISSPIFASLVNISTLWNCWKTISHMPCSCKCYYCGGLPLWFPSWSERGPKCRSGARRPKWLSWQQAHWLGKRAGLSGPKRLG